MYQVLARKYRPRNFNELVGQNHVSRALTSALDRGRLHHAYLFTGTRGVGKTTIARILAKCLNCETGVTSTPCEICATCRAVNEGRFIDLIEIDAASRTKVEDTRELLDNVPYAPTQGRYKVYLIDEVHMLSTHSFNALLKTLEEPPEHVKFLFATTDPQKLPITVISRCLQFTLRPLAVDEITTHLTNILNKESIASDQDAIWQIAESAQGSLRDALSLTDQAIAYGQGEIHHQDVKEMLGLIDRTIIYDLILAIHQNQRAKVSQLLLQFRQQALDVSMVLDQFISTLHELALLQYLPDLSLKYSAEINQKIMQLSGLISAQDLQLYYQIACKGRADLQLAVTQEQGFEMTVLRLLAFRPLQANEVVVNASSPNSQQMIELSATQTQHVETNIQPLEKTALSEKEVDTSVEMSTHNQVQQARSELPNSHEDEYSDEDDVVAQPNNIHEPSSDDFLDEPLISQENNVEIAQDTQIQESALKPVLDQPEQQTQAESNIEHRSENVEIESDLAPTLTMFGAENVIKDSHENTEENIAESDEIFFLNPEPEQVDTAQKIEPKTVQDSSILEPTLIVSTAHDSVIKLQDISQQTPQEILTLKEQNLEGEWTVDKWEFWFRNSELSPAVQELAQYGVMKGHIDSESFFHIPQKYEKLLNQLQYALEDALKQRWSNTKFFVQYEEVNETTPYQMQHERKARAFQRANDMLHEEPTVKNLIQSFDGELQNIQLK